MEIGEDDVAADLECEQLAASRSRISEPLLSILNDLQISDDSICQTSDLIVKTILAYNSTFEPSMVLGSAIFIACCCAEDGIIAVKNHESTESCNTNNNNNKVKEHVRLHELLRTLQIHSISEFVSFVSTTGLDVGAHVFSDPSKAAKSIKTALSYIKQVESNMSTLFAKFKTLWANASKYLGLDPNNHENKDDHSFSIAWMTFIIARHRICLIGSENFDLSTLFHLQIAVVHFLRFTCMDHSIRARIRQDQKIANVSDMPSSLRYLCDDAHRDVVVFEVRAMETQIELLFQNELITNGVLGQNIRLSMMMAQSKNMNELNPAIKLRITKLRMRLYILERFVLRIADFDETSFLEFESPTTEEQQSLLDMCFSPSLLLQEGANRSRPVSRMYSRSSTTTPSLLPPPPPVISLIRLGSQSPIKRTGTTPTKCPPDIALKHQNRRRLGSYGDSSSSSLGGQGSLVAAAAAAYNIHSPSHGRRLFDETASHESSSETSSPTSAFQFPDVSDNQESFNNNNRGTKRSTAGEEKTKESDNPSKGLQTPKKSFRAGFGAAYSPATSRYNKLESKTPVSSSIEANSWLRRELDYAPDAPSMYLTTTFADCNQNPKLIISKVLAQMHTDLNAAYIASTPSTASSFQYPSSSTMPDIPSLSTQSVNEHIDRQIVTSRKLFYRLLENILRGERERLLEIGSGKVQDFSQLLGNETFIRSLFACALEVVCCAKHVFKLMYPLSLEILKISAFDLVKVSEYCIRYLPSLPRMLVSHMNFISQNALLEAAWSSHSSSKLLVLVSSPSIKSNHSANMNDNNNNNNNQNEEGIDETKYPNYDHLILPSLIVGTREDDRMVFMKRILDLAEARLTQLYSVITIPESIQRSIMVLFDICMKDGHAMQILRDRHLDHVLLCCFYSICKLAGHDEVTFKELISAYQKTLAPLSNLNEEFHNQQHRILRDEEEISKMASAKFCERFVMDIQLKNPEKRGNLIEYYNQVFIVEMKDEILQCKPLILSMENEIHLNSNKITKKNHHHPSPKIPNMTPRMKSLYAFSRQNGNPSNLSGILEFNED